MMTKIIIKIKQISQIFFFKLTIIFPNFFLPIEDFYWPLVVFLIFDIVIDGNISIICDDW
jgi:hypothetical protein